MGRLVFVSFGLLVVFLSLSGTGADCPSGWYTYEGHCYKFFQQKMTWEDAEKFCTQHYEKSHLVSFRSSEEVDFLVSLLKLDLFWMGRRDIWNERRLQWSDGTKVDYKDWRAEPECIVCRATDNQWFSTSCSQTLNVVCKFET